MAQVVFETDQITKDVPDGSDIAIIANGAGASLPFYCYEGACETCRVLVVGGGENLNDANPKEMQTLGDEKIAKGYRLGCQVKILRGKVILQNGWKE